MSIHTLVLVSLLALPSVFARSVRAQEHPSPPHTSLRGFGGPSVGLTFVDAGVRPITGGRGGLIFADTFALAIVVVGTAVFDKLRPGDDVSPGLGYLGFGAEASFAFLPGRLLRPRLGVLLGGVYLERTRVTQRSEGYGFMVEPHVAMEVRASAIVRCSLVLGARAIVGSDLALTRRDRIGPTLSVQVEFGTPSSSGE